MWANLSEARGLDLLHLVTAELVLPCQIRWLLDRDRAFRQSEGWTAGACRNAIPR